MNILNKCILILFLFHGTLQELLRYPKLRTDRMMARDLAKLIIRGVTLINSTGAPPIGPIDIVVENNIIKQIKSVGYPGAPVDEKTDPKQTLKIMSWIVPECIYCRALWICTDTLVVNRRVRLQNMYLNCGWLMVSLRYVILQVVTGLNGLWNTKQKFEK